MFDRVRYKRLVPRGLPGLACDENGIALGPIPLIVRQRATTRGWKYQPVSPDIVDRAMAAAYEAAYTPHRSWFYSWLGDVAEKMSASQHFSARTAAVQLGLPEISPPAFSRLNDLAFLLKFNPNVGLEARDSHGRWTSGAGGGARGPVIPVIGPFSPECVKAITDAKNRCAQRYANLGGGLGFDWMRRCIRMFVPEECGY
ncbi:MAG TPA: hypothetical protein VKU84_09905 [Stellaceae bacterium]|nr:hypothetical protein [Stellaceae bacterium]